MKYSNDVVLNKLKHFTGQIPRTVIPNFIDQKYRRTTHREKLNQPPGTLVKPAKEKEGDETSVQVFRYNENNVEEQTENIDLNYIAAKISTDTTTWINIHGLTDVELIKDIGKIFNLDKLVLEDLLELDQRPKVQEFEDYLFFTLKSIRLQDDDQIMMEQMSFVLGDGFVISFQEKKADIFEHIRDRIRTHKALIRSRKEDYLLYVMLDSIVDHYIILSEDLEDRMENLQNVLTKNPGNTSLVEIEDLKRIFIKLKRSIWPVRDAAGFLDKGGNGRISASVLIFYHDLYDLIQTVLDSIDSNRQIMDGLTNIYLSSLSNKMNETMKILTVISAIFIPLTFIAGVYGMNFEYMPELQLEHGYFYTWGIMIVVSLGLVYFFKRRGWFS